jgi:2-keto-3-deoxy-6-phosphogluconate aldolase
VGLGSQLTPKGVIEKRDFKFIEEKVRESVAFVKEFRKR